jgi:endonuclease/exonuclease/phosphatase family metal-dependent hydrolase
MKQIFKISSWNICATNSRYPEIIQHIEEQDADIICLQEVIEDALSQFKKIKGYNLSFILQAEGKKTHRNVYKIILTKHKVSKKGSFTVQKDEAKTLWAWCIKTAFGLKKINHEGIYVDIGNKLRVINLHLDASVSPKKRLDQFITALKYLDRKKPTIICGDFNTYGKWYINWMPMLLMKMKLKDFFFDEIKEFQSVFKKYNLEDIFYKRNTVNLLMIFWTHADYILVPDKLEIKSRHIDRDSVGSDHNMVIAEVEVD